MANIKVYTLLLFIGAAVFISKSQADKKPEIAYLARFFINLWKKFIPVTPAVTTVKPTVAPTVAPKVAPKHAFFDGDLDTEDNQEDNQEDLPENYPDLTPFSWELED